MKARKIIIPILVVTIASLGLLQSCKKSDFNINQNPNSPTDSTVTYNVLLAAAQQGTAYAVETDWGFLQNWLGYWARSGTYAANIQEETYQVTTNFQTNVWTDFYANTYNYEVMRQKSKQAGATFYEGVARMMKAHNFAILVDVYGNVPYFGALQGSGNITPKYDDAKAIYQDLFRQIDTAITQIRATVAAKNVDYKTNDLMFAGDTAKWVRFGNTLKLRWLMHLYQVPGFDIAGEMNKIVISGSGFLGSGENAQVNPGFSASKPNPFYRTYVKDEGGTATGNSVYYKGNQYAIDYYKYDGDPRLDYFYTAGANGQVGVKYGLPPTTDNAAANLSAVNGKGLLKNSGYDSPAWIFTSVESLFLQAEARFRNIITTGATAQARTTAAIQESFLWLGIPNAATAANSYIASNAGYADVDFTAAPVAGSGLPAGIYTIIQQKWFALNAIAPFEVWTDYRRTDIVYGKGGGYDPGPPLSVATSNTATKIPLRLFYPQNEYNYNGANVATQGSLNAFTSKIFWDIN